jgi:UDP-glucose 4-epimerase
MKILITGGAGYIGSNTILELLDDASIQVVSVDNFANSSFATYDRIKLISNKTIKHYDIDLNDENAVSAMYHTFCGF